MFSVFSLFSLYRGHFKNSKKILFYSSIGLIIALTLFSSSLYFIDNSRQELLTTQINQNTNYGNDIVAQLTTNFEVGNTSNRINNITNSISNTINKYDFSFINQSETKVSAGYGNMQIVLPVTGILSNRFQTSYHYKEASETLVYQLTPYFKNNLEILHNLSSNSKNKRIQFPQNQQNLNYSNLEAYLLYINTPPYAQLNIPSLAKNGTMEIYYSTSIDPKSIRGFNFSIIDSEVYQYQPNFELNLFPGDLSPTSALSSEIPYLNGLITGNINNNQNQFNIPGVQSYSTDTRSILFVSNITQFGELIQNSYGQLKPSITNNYIVHIGFNYQKIDLSQINSFLAKQNYFYSTIQGVLLRQDFTSVNFTFLTSESFSAIESEIQSMTDSFFVTDLPILIISFFLANYCFNLIYTNIVRNISIYKTRGASTWLILGFQLIDLFVIIGLSIFASLLLGIPLSVLSLKADYLFSFNNPSPAYYIFKYESIAGALFLWGLVFVLINNFNRVRQLSKVSIADTENPSEDSTPFWQNHYLDVIMLGFGSVMIAFFYFLIHDNGLVQTFGSVLPIISLLLIPSPFVFVIGLILIISRLIPIILNRVGTFLWDIHGGLTAYSFKNILRYKNTTIRGILLISVVIAFLLFFYSSPFSMIENYKLTTEYDSGSDGTATFSGTTINYPLIQLLQTKFSQYIDSTSAFAVLNVGSSYNNQINFLLINTSTYVQSANLNFDLGLKNNIQKDFNNLSISNVDPNSTSLNILVNQAMLSPHYAHIGSNISLANNLYVQNFRIQDTFTHWPFLEPYFQSPYYAIGDINYYTGFLNQSISKSIFTNVFRAGVFIHFKPNINLKLAIQQIQDQIPITFIHVPQLGVNQFTRSFSYLSLTGQINLNILISLLVIFIIILLFIQFQISERRQEIYTERALGMKTSQLSLIFYLENMIVLLFSILIGTIIGIFFVQLVGFITQSPTQTYPPNIVVIPLDIVVLSDILIFLSGIFLSIIPSIIISRQDISKSFVTEM